jgi:hypothetical protein
LGSDDSLFAKQSLSFQAIVADSGYEDFFAEKILALLPTLQTLTFLSYSRNDSKIVGWVRERLENAGFRCWQDTSSIDAGILWDDEIEKALTECTHVIFFVSQASLQSQNVKDEIGYARQLNKAIIPVVVDETPEGAMPFRAHRYQAVKMYGDRQSGMEKLIASLTAR